MVHHAHGAGERFFTLPPRRAASSTHAPHRPHVRTIPARAQLDIFNLPALRCAVDFDAFGALQATVLMPFVFVFVVIVVRKIARLSSIDAAARAAQNAFATTALLVVSYAFYPTIAATCFAFYPCDTFEYSQGPRSFVRADLSISCDEDAHTGRLLFNALSTLFWVMGTPIVWASKCTHRLHCFASAGASKHAKQCNSRPWWL